LLGTIWKIYLLRWSEYPCRVDSELSLNIIVAARVVSIGFSSNHCCALRRRLLCSLALTGEGEVRIEVVGVVGSIAWRELTWVLWTIATIRGHFTIKMGGIVLCHVLLPLT
jgi:hypothetical protein